MKVCVAQTSSIKGDIESNIIHHKKMIEAATAHRADIIIFPELSLTGYEPTLAHSLAMDPSDSRFDDFQTISDTRRIVIAVGVPTRSDRGICISLIIFQPHQQPLIYSKKYLHPDEEAYFVPGNNFPVLEVQSVKLAFAICYELSIQAHADNAFMNGADVYIASVAKYERSIKSTSERLSEIARENSTWVVMANSVGEADGEFCTGNSSAWNKKGKKMARLGTHEEGIIIIDMDTQKIILQTM